jgi:hypothetical protein
MTLHVLAIATLLPIAATVPRPEPARALMDFVDRVTEYVEIRREVTAGIDGPAFCSDPEELSRQVHQRAAAIRAARPLAAEGTIFTPRVADFFRARLDRAGQTAIDATPGADGDDTVVLEVYTVLPWSVGTPASARLVSVLPLLPDELQYRFVGRDLVLLDVDLNLVVDILREAVPPAPVESPASRSMGTCDVHPDLPECWM